MTRLSPQRTGQLHVAAERWRLRALEAAHPLPCVEDEPVRCGGCGGWLIPGASCVTCIVLTVQRERAAS